MSEFKLGPLQTKWLEALKSGKYQHGRGLLCKINSKGKMEYCCLGVLCEIMGVEKTMDDHFIQYELHNASLPPGIAKQVGLRSEHGDIANPSIHGDLTKVNDNSRYGFQPVIDIMEKEPQRIFTESL